MNEQKDNRKLFAFYLIAGTLAVIGGGGMLAETMFDNTWSIMTISYISGIALGLTFLHRAYVLDTEREKLDHAK